MQVRGRFAKPIKDELWDDTKLVLGWNADEAEMEKPKNNGGKRSFSQASVSKTWEGGNESQLS